MYTIEQVQAADYLLKKILNQKDFPFYEKDLKIVIELNGLYWYGDFVTFKSGSPVQYFIHDDGDVDFTRFYYQGSNATSIFKKTIDTYESHANSRDFFSNPFKKISTLDLLFNTLFKLIKLANIKPDDSPLYPYLLNAKTLDGSMELPFINLENQSIKVVSLIELKDVAD